MKIVCAQDELLAKLQIAARGVSQRSTVQILSGVLLSATASGVEALATDMELSLRVPIDAQVQEPGEVVLPGRLLLEIVRALPAAEVTIGQPGGSGAAQIECGPSRYSLHTQSAELEGALTRVIAYASLTGRPVSTDLAEEVLRNLFPQGSTRTITIDQIQSAVSERFHVPISDLRGDRRQQSIAYPRHIAMYLCRELTDASLPKIGAKFGGRDHSTVLHGVNKITRVLKEDREAFNVVQELTTRIKQGR